MCIPIVFRAILVRNFVVCHRVVLRQFLCELRVEVFRWGGGGECTNPPQNPHLEGQGQNFRLSYP
jgi:hypothetical protein